MPIRKVDDAKTVGGGITMAQVKEEVIQLIENLPDECSISDIMAELYFKQKVEEGLYDIEQGRILSQEEIRKQMAQWAKSIGR